MLFLSTPSARRATTPKGVTIRARKISIHALREEGDTTNPILQARQQNFYPRPPRGGRRLHHGERHGRNRFLSTPSARRATLDGIPDEPNEKYFYPRPPRGGRPAFPTSMRPVAKNFYPRPPRGGRPGLPRRHGRHPEISIHALREEGDVMGKSHKEIAKISIHALREEGDRQNGDELNFSGLFLSTPSARRATMQLPLRVFDYKISIHALREEGDATGAYCRAKADDFYPRPPRGGRRGRFVAPSKAYVFLSTPSARRATDPRVLLQRARTISIHALREEGDVHQTAHSRPRCDNDFYPRPPRGGRQNTQTTASYTEIFLSTPSARRATDRRKSLPSPRANFYPRPPRGGRLIAVPVVLGPQLISIHALREEGDFRLPCCRCSTADFYPRPPRGGRQEIKMSFLGILDFYPRPPRGGRLDRIRPTDTI